MKPYFLFQPTAAFIGITDALRHILALRWRHRALASLIHCLPWHRAPRSSLLDCVKTDMYSLTTQQPYTSDIELADIKASIENNQTMSSTRTGGVSRLTPCVQEARTAPENLGMACLSTPATRSPNHQSSSTIGTLFHMRSCAPYCKRTFPSYSLVTISWHSCVSLGPNGDAIL